MMSTHEGPVTIRHTSWGVLILCPLGHVMEGRANDRTMGGSAFMARVAQHQHDGSWRVTCDGEVA